MQCDKKKQYTRWLLCTRAWALLSFLLHFYNFYNKVCNLLKSISFHSTVQNEFSSPMRWANAVSALGVYTDPFDFSRLLLHATCSMTYLFRYCRQISFSVQIDGQFPPSTRTLSEGGNLTIVDLESADEGLYECVANSPVTSSVASTMLLIEGEQDFVCQCRSQLKYLVWLKQWVQLIRLLSSRCKNFVEFLLMGVDIHMPSVNAPRHACRHKKMQLLYMEIVLGKIFKKL